MRKIIILSITICIFTISCVNNTESVKGNKNQTHRFESFSLTYPSNITVNKKAPAGDFDIYEFTQDGNLILSAYVGNQPNFYEKAKNADKIEKGFINRLNFESFTLKMPDGSIEKETLINFSKNQGWPRYIHFWYSNFKPEIRNIAEQIIFSTKEI